MISSLIAMRAGFVRRVSFSELDQKNAPERSGAFLFVPGVGPAPTLL